MNEQFFNTFSKEFSKLKEQLKCAICLDIIQEHRELECGHRFCTDCYNSIKNIKSCITCPLCKNNILRRAPVYKDELADNFGYLISKICNRIGNIKKSTDTLSINEEPLVRKTVSNKSSKVVKPVKNKFLIPKKKFKPLDHDEPSTSNEDTFEKLRINHQFNKKGINITYSRKKKENHRNDVYKILEFDNNDTKNAVLRWLNDNRNTFERLTQTQALIVDNDQIPIIDLTSMSQVQPNKIETPHRDQRAKSLDLDLDKSVREKSRLSDIGNYHTDETNTENVLKKAEENVLMDIIENEFLDKLENELQNKDTTQNSTSGWERIEKISKSLRKKGKQPKKLKVTVQSSQNVNVKKESEQILRISLKNGICHGVKNNHTNEDDKIQEVLDDFANTKNLQNISNDKENDENIANVINDPKLVILNDVIIREANTSDNLDPYLLPTQKNNNSKERNDQSDLKLDTLSQISECDSSDFVVVINKMKTKLEIYLDYIDNNKRLSSQNIEIIQTYLEKLENIHSNIVNKSPIKCLSQNIQTECIMCHISTQTEQCDEKTLAPTIQPIPKDVGKNLDSNKLMKKTQIDEFIGSLDFFNFETQDIKNQHLLKNNENGPEKINQKSPEKLNQKSPEKLDNKSTEKLDQKCQEKNKQKSPEKQVNKNLKRVLSDSDSSDVVGCFKKKCNRFIRYDLSVEFDATEKSKSQKTTNLWPESDNENDDEYLEKILKKYEKGESRKEDQNTDEDYDKIVANVNKNVEKLSKQNEITSKTNLDDDTLFFNDHNKYENTIRFHTEQKEDSEIPDIIAETETFEPIIKKLKLGSLSKPVHPIKSKDNLEDHTVKPRSDKIEHDPDQKNLQKEDFCPELEDSLNGVDFDNIELEAGKKIENATKFNEEDLFSDEDVVETTPQKEKIPEKRSQCNLLRDISSCFPMLNDGNKKIDDDFDLDFVPLAPPPGFEDDCGSISVNVTLNKYDRHQSPPSKEFLQNTSLNPLNISLHKVQHSTPSTQKSFQQESLGLSPIVREKSAFEKAYNSSNTLISLSSQETPRKHILTSNPKQKSILNYVTKKKPCIACTRLSKDQIQSISLLTNKKLATYSAKFTDSVTHMIVSVDESRRIKDYTMKFVAAVASGIWVLSFEWIQECLKNNSIVHEFPYEVFDDSGNPGPKLARLKRNTEPLLKSYRFYCVRPLYSITVEDIEDVVIKLGGTMVRNLESLSKNDVNIDLIITEGRSTQDFEIYERWLEKYKIVTVDIEWLSRSVGQYKILSVRPFIWCSDDLLDDLGYPPHLTEYVPSSSEPV